MARCVRNSRTLARRIWRTIPGFVRRSHVVAQLTNLFFPVEPIWLLPLNDQLSKRHIVEDVLASWPFRAVVETGTGFGATSALLATMTGLPTYTVEEDPRRFTRARRRLRHVSRVQCVLDDSRRFLRRLACDRSVPRRDVFFYLDAHGADDDLPLREEVALIASCWSDSVIMIDDFEVPDDPGYGADEWGGHRLCLAYLPPLPTLNLEAFFPSTPAAADTGDPRGCVVLSPPSLAARLRALPSLRAYQCERPERAISEG
jgi:hypothetical protein